MEIHLRARALTPCMSAGACKPDVWVNGTQWLTLYSWHRKRGQEAMDTIGILPHDTGRAMHDRLSSYDHYSCQQSVCGAHLLRDCLWVVEREKLPWAKQMYDLLRRMAQAAAQWRAQGAKALPKTERDEWIAQYFSLLADGFAAHLAQAPPEGDPQPKKQGRQKQLDSKNLLDALLKRAEQVLAFLDDLCVLFTNNLAERDVRMIPRSAQDFRHLSQRARSHGFLHHSQVSVYHAQAGSLPAFRFGCGL